MNEISKIEQQDIELQIKEIQLQRELNALKKEQLTGLITVPQEVNMTIEPKLCLTYSKVNIENIMRIADVCPDGSLKIYARNNSTIFAKKYTINTLLWIRKNLGKWSVKQKQESNFFKNIAEQYSRRFGESVSRTTMEKLCYVVDSGKADEFFEKYDNLRSAKQSTLKI